MALARMASETLALALLNEGEDWEAMRCAKCDPSR